MSRVLKPRHSITTHQDPKTGVEEYVVSDLLGVVLRTTDKSALDRFYNKPKPPIGGVNKYGLANSTGNAWMSKKITGHPGVLKTTFGPEKGSRFKYYVELMEGWVFMDGRDEGASKGFFNSAIEFLAAKPKKKKVN